MWGLIAIVKLLESILYTNGDIWVPKYHFKHQCEDLNYKSKVSLVSGSLGAIGS